MNEAMGLRRSKRRRRSTVVTLLVVGAVWAAFYIPSFMRARATMAGLSVDTVSSVEFRPNGDWAVLSLTSPKQIEGFLAWLDSTRDARAIRSAPPPTAFDGTIFFSDGRKEEFRISASMEPKTEKMRYEEFKKLEDNDELAAIFNAMRDHEPPVLSTRGDVRIFFRDIMRTGDRQPLSDLVHSWETQK